jgi:hypothetical protein
MSTEENASLGDTIRDVLLAVVYSQNEANKSFIAGIEELAQTDVTIAYTKTIDGKAVKQEIKGNALAFGVMPSLLAIQSSTIELRTALQISKNQSSSQTSKNLSERAGYRFKTSTVDAKYQNAYNFKAETSSIIKITIVPVPPSAEMLEAIKAASTKNAAIEE